MYKIIRTILLCTPLYFSQGIVATQSFDQLSFDLWEQTCSRLPRFKEHANNPCATPLTQTQFCSTLQNCCEMLEQERTSLLHTQKTDAQFYAAKIVLPETAIVAVHGDLHGDIHSLNNFIKSCVELGYLDPQNPFKIIHPDFYILFLGDYVDRGWYGCEVLYTIARLKCTNPDRVLMVRGNHEDISLNKRYGFAQELKKKFQSPVQAQALCTNLYQLLPVALYLGTQHDYIQCCHGGIEPGFDPRPLLATTKKRCAQNITTISPEHFVTSGSIKAFEPLKNYFTHSRSIDEYNGFMWNDFIVDADQMLQIQLSPRDGYAGNMFQFGKVPTHAFLKKCSSEKKHLRCIFRAHQHSDSLMRERMLNLDQLGHDDDTGIAKLWIESSIHRKIPHLLKDIDVVTFWVAPDAGYKSSIHAFGLLSLAHNYADWRLQVIRIAQA